MMNENYKGEDPEIEMNAIHKFFPNADIVREYGYNGQVHGTDYYVTIGGDNKGKIDTKIHYYDSDILVYEIDDKRPGWKGYVWGDPKSGKETDGLIWIIAAKNKAYLFNYKVLVAHYNQFISEYVHEDYMDTKDGTVNLYLPIEDLKCIDKLIYKEIDLDCSKLKSKIKPNKYPPAHKIEYDELKKTFDERVKQLRHGAGEDMDDANFYEFYVKPFKENKYFNKLRSDKDLFGENITFSVVLQRKGMSL